MLRFRKVVLGLALMASAACAAQKAATPEPVVLPPQPDAPVAAAEEDAPSLTTLSPEEEKLVARVDAGSNDLPEAWTKGPALKPVLFKQAMSDAATTRRNFDAVLASLRDAGVPSASTFGRGANFVDYTSRLYATAFYASDATPVGKVDALRAAAEMELAWSRRLDELGLEKMPDAWRSDPSLALTFEDMTTGPVKRWRKEGLALVELCVAMARESNLDTPSARSCLQLRRNVARTVLPPEKRETAASKDAGASTNAGCGCNPGDPLCSASMNGWCGSTR